MELDALNVPDELSALRELECRLGQVIDWTYDAYAIAHHKRSTEFAAAMKLDDLKRRSSEFLTLDKRFYARIKEIEETELAFRKAYDEQKKSINFEPILERSINVMPIVSREERDITRNRAQKKLDEINERTNGLKESKKKKKINDQ